MEEEGEGWCEWRISSAWIMSMYMKILPVQQRSHHHHPSRGGLVVATGGEGGPFERAASPASSSRFSSRGDDGGGDNGGGGGVYLAQPLPRLPLRLPHAIRAAAGGGGAHAAAAVTEADPRLYVDRHTRPVLSIPAAAAPRSLAIIPPNRANMFYLLYTCLQSRIERRHSPRS